ncbi:MAG: hypothetical protein GC150_05130 [Rhizobiales bacterium]|nr:hypothetical protein [Hyphomicrobiales bacterium]
MTVTPDSLLAILAMGLATYATRSAGVLLLSRIRPGRVLQAALDALPVAILTSVIAPSIASAGPATWLAALATAIAGFRLPLFATFAVGIVSVVVLRRLLGA